MAAKRQADEQAEGQVVIHRSRLASPLALCINHIAVSPDQKHMTVLRNFAQMRLALNKLKIPVCAIEIYKLYNHRDGLAKRLRFIHDTEAIQAIAWLDNDTIISASMNQNINIYDIVSGVRLFQFITDFGAIFCLKHEPQIGKIFVGTEFGYVCSYDCDYESKTLSFDKKMVKIPTKILSIDVHVKNEQESTCENIKQEPDKQHDIRIVGGTVGKAIVWDYHSGSIEETLNLESTKTNIIVWAVLVLSGSGEIVTGDSSGVISIFDPKSLTFMQRFQLHTADILCLAKTEDENEIFASGIDPTIRSIERAIGKRITWTSKCVRHFHTHDVRSLATVGNDQLYSGGSDTFLTFTRFPDPSKRRFVIKSPDLYQISSPDELLIQSEAGLTIWTLATHQMEEAQNLSEGETAEPSVQDAEPTNLINLTTRYFVMCSCFNLEWMCYYTYGSKRPTFYRRLPENLVKVKLEDKLPNTIMMRMVGNADRSIVFAICNDSVEFIELKEVVNSDDERIQTCSRVGLHELDSTPYKVEYVEAIDTLILYCRAKEAETLKIMRLKDHLPVQINTIDLQSNILSDFVVSICHEKPHKRSPKKLRSSIIEPSKSKVILYAYTFDDEIITVDLEENVLRSTDKVKGILEHSEIIGMLSYGPNLVLYDDQHVYKLDSFKVVKTLDRYRYIQKILRIPRENGSSPEWLVVEFPHKKLLSTLPPPLNKKKYGTR